MTKITVKKIPEDQEEAFVKFIKKNFPHAKIQIIGNPGRPVEASKLAEEFLLRELKDGPKKIRELMRLAEKEKFAWSTLVRVRRRKLRDKIFVAFSKSGASWSLEE